MHWKERALSREKVELLKRTVAKGTDDDQFALFMHVCQHHGLDPFVKQVYCVLFPVSKHHIEKKQTSTGEMDVWMPGHEMVIITGIGGYRKMAARDYKDYAGSSAAEFTWFDPPRKTPAGRDIPRSATMKIFRRGMEPTVATVFWDEYAPKDLTASRSDFWNRMPCNQLEKCCESKGIRKACPGLGDVFTDVEMSQRLHDLTDGGRQIIEHDGRAPSGAIADHRIYDRDASKRILADKLGEQFCEKHKCPESQCPSDGHTPEENDAAMGRLRAKNAKPVEGVPGAAWKAQTEKKADKPPKAVPAPPQSHSDAPQDRPQGAQPRPASPSGAGSPAPQSGPAPGSNGIVELDWTGKDGMESPILRGDIGNLLEMIQKHCKATWSGEWWHVTAAEADTIRAMCQQLGYRLLEFFPKTAVATLPPRSSPQVSGARHGAPEKTTAGNRARSAPSAPAVVFGIIERTNMGMAGKAPVKYLTLLDGKKKIFLGCFHKSMWDALEEGLGKQASFAVVTKGDYTNVERLIKIGDKEWDEQGTPVIQRKDQKAGQRTLY